MKCCRCGDNRASGYFVRTTSGKWVCVCDDCLNEHSNELLEKIKGEVEQ